MDLPPSSSEDEEASDSDQSESPPNALSQTHTQQQTALETSDSTAPASRLQCAQLATEPAGNAMSNPIMSESTECSAADHPPQSLLQASQSIPPKPLQQGENLTKSRQQSRSQPVHVSKSENGIANEASFESLEAALSGSHLK